ncbi:citryl-CoA lyase [Paracoccus pacificus]|uniref:Citryl-CoA lyase n=1 Tax=Paracoccus pacificus TaxID=1463598 RepID=A0ABW4R343_9RHOB
MSPKTVPQTALCSYTTDAVYYRDQNLVGDLLGNASFVDVFIRQILGRQLGAGQMAIVEAVLIMLMEHGMTPSAIAARMVYASSPENIQSGVAAGLLAVGSQFVGTMEQAAELLARISSAPDPAAEATEIAQDHRRRKDHVPGFGHHLHRPDDPRAIALLAMAKEKGVAGDYCRALNLLAAEVDRAANRHITINATGAIAAVLGDIGIPVRLMRGFAVLSRAAGLISHLAEEQQDPAGRFIWSLVDEAMLPARPGNNSN